MQSKKRCSSEETREKILCTADKLFYNKGIKSVGIDTIILESGVAKMSLYKHFSSKDNLVIEYLNNRDKVFYDRFNKYLDDTSSENPILDLFTAVVNYFSNEEKPHCPFLNVLVEFSDNNDDFHKIILNNKIKIREKFKDILLKRNSVNIDEKVDHIMLLWHGLIINVQIFGKNYDTKNFLNIIKEITS